MRRDEAGFTLVEVMVSLMICTFALIGGLTVIGQASEDVIDTVEQRKMRYLVQNILGDIEKGRFLPGAPEEELEAFYEEGESGDFNDFASDFDPDEYRHFGWEVRVFREEVIVGAPDDETLEEMGFIRDENGNISGRPVSNDPELYEPRGGRGAAALGGAEGLGAGGTGEEAEAPPSPGQIKRVLIFTVVRYGEEEQDNRKFTVMTYLPHPDEEQQQLGEGAGGEGEGGGEAGGETPAGEGDTRSEAGASGTSVTRGGGSDR